MYLKDFKEELHEVVKRLHTQGRRGSEKLSDSTGNTLSRRIFLALRHCVLAASSADAYAKKFLQSLQPSEGKFGVELSIERYASFQLWDFGFDSHFIFFFMFRTMWFAGGRFWIIILYIININFSGRGEHHMRR